MRKSILIYLILLCCIEAYAKSPIATTEGEPSAIVGGCLNAVTGEAIFQENDIVIAGVEPIRLPRIYLSGAREEGGNGWFFSSDLYAIYSPENNRIEIPERNGSRLKFISERGSKGRCRDFKKKKGYRFVPEITENGKGWTNSANGRLSGRINQKNYVVFLDHD